MYSALNFNNTSYISSKDAAKISGYTRDYISRLCRSGILEGKLVGRAWFVNEDELQNFLAQQTTEKELLSAKLSEERRQEYLAGLKAREQRHDRQVVSFDPVTFVLTSVAQKRQALAYAMLLVVMTFSLQMISYDALTKSSTQISYQSANVLDAVGDVATSVSRFFANLAKRTFALVAPSKSHEVAMDTKDDMVEKSANAVAPTADFNEKKDAMLIIPEDTLGVASDSERRREIEKIKQSFSDEVTITEDTGGESGVITPIFKERDGSDYLYVLVPLNEKDP